jgi:hypothetical protein
MLDSLKEFYTRHNNGRPATKHDVQGVVARSVEANRLSTERAKNPAGDVHIKGIAGLQNSLNATNKNLTDLRVTDTRSMQSISRQVMLTGRDTNRELRELRKTLQKQHMTTNRENALSRQHESKQKQQSLRVPAHLRDVYVDDKVRSMHSHAALVRSMSMPRDARGRWTTKEKQQQQQQQKQEGGGGASIIDTVKDFFIGGAIWKGVKTFGGALLRGVSRLVEPVVRALPLVAEIAPAAASTATGALAAIATSPITAGVAALGAGELAGHIIHQEDMRLPEPGEDTRTHKLGRFGDKVNDALGYIGLGSHVDHGNKQAEADAAMYAEIDRKKAEVEKKDSSATLGTTYADTISSLAGTAMGWIKDEAVATSTSLLNMFKSVKQIEDEQAEKDKKVVPLGPVKRKDKDKDKLGKGGTPGSGGSDETPGGGGDKTPGGGSGDKTPGGGGGDKTPESGKPNTETPDADKPVSPTGAFKPKAKSDNNTPDPVLGASLDTGKPKKFDPNAAKPDPPVTPEKKGIYALDPALKPKGKQSEGSPDSTPDDSKPDTKPAPAPSPAPAPKAVFKPSSKPNSGGDAPGPAPQTKPSPDSGNNAPESKRIPVIQKPQTPEANVFKPAQIPFEKSSSQADKAWADRAFRVDPLGPPKANVNSAEPRSSVMIAPRAGMPDTPKESFDALRNRAFQRPLESAPPETTPPAVNNYNSGAVAPVSTEPAAPVSDEQKSEVSPPQDSVSNPPASEPYISDVPQQVSDPALRKIQSHDNA